MASGGASQVGVTCENAGSGESGGEGVNMKGVFLVFENLFASTHTCD